MDSLLNQTRKDFKIILVDDGSPDNCGKIAEDYAAKYDFIEVIRQQNQGLAGAWNTGIKNVKTQWLSFVDADDWVEPDYIETLYNAFDNEAKNVNVVLFDYFREYKASSARAQYKADSGLLNAQEFSEFKKAIFFRFESNRALGFYDAPVAWGKAYRTDYLVKNNIRFTLACRKGQDRVFNSEAFSRSGGVYYVCKPIYHYLLRVDSRTNRYDKKVPELVTIELKAEQEVIEHFGFQDVVEAHNCYISTRLYSCMRLCYFSKNNPDSFKEKVRGINTLANSEPFKTALKEADMGLLNSQEKIFVMCVKLKLYRLASLLVRYKNWKTSKELA